MDIACTHIIKEVEIGGRKIYAGAGLRLIPEDMTLFDERVMLRAEQNWNARPFGEYRSGFLWLPIEDFETVPKRNWSVWKHWIARVADWLRDERQVIVFCAGGHGRTGLFLGCLLAHVEPETRDPVRAIRERYCPRAIETHRQEQSIARMQREAHLPLKSNRS